MMRFFLNKRILFEVSWRAGILLLPWQMRFFVHEATIQGLPWEEGTWVVYVSWFFLLAAIVAGAGLNKRDLRITQIEAWIVLLLLIASFGTISAPATIFFWIQSALMIGFALIMYRSGVSMKQVAACFVLSVIPHAALGIIQFLTQDIMASTILGIANHHPWESGTSVVEHGLYRLLRAYGGLPHPNILGGYIAIALTLLPMLMVRLETKLPRLFLLITGPVLGLALIFTFSRGAWIAAVLGFVSAFAIEWMRSKEGFDRQALAILGVITALIVSGAVFTQFDHVIARFNTEHRLEAWSLEQRKGAIEKGFEAWKEKLIFGYGPGAGKWGVIDPDIETLTIPPEPPHAVPLVILLETGVLGFAAFLLFMTMMLQRAWAARAIHVLPLLAAYGVIMLTDHYPWTLWSGKALSILVLLTVFLELEQAKKSDP